MRMIRKPFVAVFIMAAMVSRSCVLCMDILGTFLQRNIYSIKSLYMLYSMSCRVVIMWEIFCGVI